MDKIADEINQDRRRFFGTALSQQRPVLSVHTNHQRLTICQLTALVVLLDELLNRAARHRAVTDGWRFTVRTYMPLRSRRHHLCQFLRRRVHHLSALIELPCRRRS